MRYEIEVKEELSRIVCVKADSLEDAIRKVEDKYKECKIVLDEEDFKGVSIDEYKPETIVRTR